jgi:hypothetical protein
LIPASGSPLDEDEEEEDAAPDEDEPPPEELDELVDTPPVVELPDALDDTV